MTGKNPYDYKIISKNHPDNLQRYQYKNKYNYQEDMRNWVNKHGVGAIYSRDANLPKLNWKR